MYLPKDDARSFLHPDQGKHGGVIDDVVVKSKQTTSLIPNLIQTFGNLRRFKIILNLTKCVFKVKAGKILGSWA